MSDDENKNERIAELEREVAELRQQLDQQPGGSTQEQEEAFFREGEERAAEHTVDQPEPDPGTPPDPGDQRELAGNMPSRRRAIIIGVCVGAVALAAIVAIVLSLSQVITPLSKSAAGALEPFEPPAKKAPAPEHPPVKATKSPMRAPGL